MHSKSLIVLKTANNPRDKAWLIAANIAKLP